MKQFPIFLNTSGKRICLIGDGADIVAKARLVAKSDAHIEIYASAPDDALAAFIADNAGASSKDSFAIYHRAFEKADLEDEARPPVIFAYLSEEAHQAEAILKAAHLPYCVIDNLARSQFTTPAIVDRAPLTIAIGTEGTAPVLARKIKAELEERLPQSIGPLARLAGQMREMVGAKLAPSLRRHFWARFFSDSALLAEKNSDEVTKRAEELLRDFSTDFDKKQHDVWFVSAGPGNPDLLTMQARRLLADADVILHDRLVPDEILELARREAEVIEVGKTGFGAGWRQDDINQLMIAKARQGHKLVRLKSGDATIFGRLDEEIAALDDHDITFRVAAGITSASAGAATAAASLTKRGRNRSLRFMTGHDQAGYADYDWRALAQGLNSGEEIIALYMARKVAPYFSGRLLMHGISPDLPVTVAQNISQKRERWCVTNLSDLPSVMREMSGPAILYLGVTPHHSQLAHLPSWNAGKVQVPAHQTAHQSLGQGGCYAREQI